jgi:DNA-binding GntR family transcriptional regulator
MLFLANQLLYPNAAQIWLERFIQIDFDQIEAIFGACTSSYNDRVPDERITATAAKFAQDLLDANRDQLLSNFVASVATTILASWTF